MSLTNKHMSNKYKLTPRTIPYLLDNYMKNLIMAFPIRILVALFVFTATMVSYMLRVNINIALVTMTEADNNTCIGQSSDYQFETDLGNTRFCWSERDQGWAKAAFYYGYIVLQVIGGSMAEKIGSKRILGYTMVLSVIITFLNPLLAKWNLWAMVIARVIIGLFQGVTYPCIPPLIQKWVPVQERAKFMSFTYLGGSFGTMFAYPLCGVILDKLDWEAVFYFTGAVGALWCILWFLIHTDEPRDQRWISNTEVDFIEKHRPVAKKEIETPPYLKILTSVPVWAIIIAEFANGWGIFMIITEGPNFISKVLDRDITSNGLLNALPHAAGLVFGQISGLLVDFILSRNILSKPTQRRIWEILAMGVPAVCVGLMGYFTDDWRICIGILTFGYGMRSFIYGAHSVNPMEISPNYAGTVYGFSNGIGCISGLITPMVTAAFTEDDPTDPANWRKLFFTGTGFYSLGVISYVFFAKFKPLPFDQERLEESRDEIVKD